MQRGPGGGKISTGNASGDRRAGTRKFSQNSKGLLTHRGEGLREFAEICIEKPGAIPARSAAAPALEDAQRPRSDRQAPPGDLPPQRVQHRPRDLRPVFTFTGCGELPSKRTTKRTKEPPADTPAQLTGSTGPRSDRPFPFPARSAAALRSASSMNTGNRSGAPSAAGTPGADSTARHKQKQDAQDVNPGTICPAALEDRRPGDLSPTGPGSDQTGAARARGRPAAAAPFPYWPGTERGR